MEILTTTLFNPTQYLTEAAVQRQSELLKRAYTNANMKAADAASDARLLALAPMQHSSDAKLSALLGALTPCSILIILHVLHPFSHSI